MKLDRVGVAAAGILVCSTLGGGVLGGRVLAGSSRLDPQLRAYTQILAAIEQNYVEEVKTDRLVSSSIREMLRTLDPHSNFYEARDFSTLQERQKGQYYGLGITVQAIDGSITVVSPFEGTPAHRLGIRAGDVITEIDGEDARGMAIDDAVKRLRGAKGTSVRVKISRQGYDQLLEFTVIRDAIPLHSVLYSFMLTRDIGYIRLVDFNEVTACRPGEGTDCERELEKALRELGGHGARALVLDIRDNPGGLLEQAFAVSNLFLKKGQLVVFTRGRTKRDESNYVTETESAWSGLPLVVLTSRHSASASEIVAGAIQDHDRGLVVGETTFGKGLVQTIMPLRNARGYALALTTARYYTPSGRSIQRDYGGDTALEDYYQPRDRRGCDEGAGDVKLTDAGRKVYGGDGITPDFCVEAGTPSRFVARLISRQSFLEFSHRFEPSEAAGGVQIAGTGSRSQVVSSKVKLIDRSFEVDPAVLADFKAFLEEKKVHFTEGEFEENRAAIAQQILEQVLIQVFGEGAARRRTLVWDPQVQKAIEVMPRAEVLLRDPARYVAEKGNSGRVADSAQSREARRPTNE